MEYPQEQVKPYHSDGKKSDQVEQMFNSIAPTYDRLNIALSFGIDRYWRRKAIKELKLAQPLKILDVATGTGDFALLACKMLGNCSLTGIDISEKMMDVAQKKVEKEGLSHRIAFQKEDCTALSFADHSFDAVTVAFGIRNFEKLDLALTEMLRVLRPGGQLIVLELSNPLRFPMKQLFGFYAHVMLPWVGKLVSKDRKAYSYLPESIEACPQREQMQAVIRKAGFAKVSYESLTMGICTLYKAMK